MHLISEAIANRIACNRIIIITTTEQIYAHQTIAMIEIKRNKKLHNNLSKIIKIFSYFHVRSGARKRHILYGTGIPMQLHRTLYLLPSGLRLYFINMQSK